jgi:excisionase family DNA binding protein
MYFTPAQVADALQVSKKTVLRRIKDGSIKAVKLGSRTVRIEEAELLKFIESKRGIK